MVCTTSVEATLNTNKRKIHLVKSNEHNSPLPLYQVVFVVVVVVVLFVSLFWLFESQKSPYIALTDLELAV